MASSFLINANRKITISGIPNGSDGVPWTWYGNVTDSSLSNISFTFTEAFEDSRKAVDENFEKITKALKKALELIVGKIPLFGKIQGFDSLRTAVIFTYSAYATMYEKSTNPEDSPIAKVSSRINTLFSRDYIYRPPIRKGMPSLNIPVGNGIEIKFEYGSCNKFNAKEEVYKPIMAIYNAIAPKMNEIDPKVGMGVWKDVVNVPYNQQILPEMITAAFKNSRDTSELVGGKFLGFVQQVGSNLSQIASQLANASDRWVNKRQQLQDEANPDIRLIDDDQKGDVMVNKQIWAKFQKESTHSVKGETVDTTLTTPALPPKAELESTFIKTNPERRFTSDDSSGFDVFANAIKNFVKNTVSSYKETIPDATKEIPDYGEDFKLTANTSERDLVTAAVNKIDKDAETQSLTLDNYVVSGTLEKGLKFVEETAPEVGSDKKSLPDILLNLVNFEYNLKGTTLMNLYKNGVEAFTRTISMGYPDIQDTDLKSLYEKTVVSDQSKIKITGILFQKVTFKFDFSHLDEDGYPMSGSIKLEQIWNTLHAGTTVYMHA